METKFSPKKKTQNNEQFTFISAEQAKWLATIAMMISAILVSFKIEWATVWWAFVGFLVGHVIWCWAAVKMREWALFSLNFSFIFVDLYAILIRT